MKWKHSLSLTVCLGGSLALASVAGIAAAQNMHMAHGTSAAPGGDLLRKGFLEPPNSARPRVWWHWMNGNIGEEGIKLDLEWMHRAGLGGVTIFEGAINTPQIVPQRLIYMTPEWKHAFKSAVETAHKLGLEVAIASSPGWSETGGPWVPPAHAMKKIVWTSTRIEGGKAFSGVLAHPPTIDGSFQNISVLPRKRADGKMKPPPEFYTDVAVIAYKLPAGDLSQAELNPKVTTSGGDADLAALSDGDLASVALKLQGVEEGRSWVLFDYGKPQKIQSLTLATLDELFSIFGHNYAGTQPVVEWSQDGEHFTPVATVPPSSIVERTVAFNAVTARYWRVAFPHPEGRKSVPAIKITELVFSSGARVNDFEKRAGFATSPDYFSIQDPAIEPEFAVKKSDVLDLTGKMSADGRLTWTQPEGKWMVLRIGSSLTGRENSPAPIEATGLEVDKLNGEYVKNYVEGYLKMYAGAIGAAEIGKGGISHLLTDSIEVGSQNWTDKMFAEFQLRRGYDARPWLPAMTGAVVGSTAETDRFLWDYRRTIAELIAENHYGAIADTLHKHGMRYYGEALESHRPNLGDDMEMRSKTDIPMGAMWTWLPGSGPASTYMADLRGAASVAHIYGQNLVGAESMTAPAPAWGWSPNSLKKVADLEFALGVNLFEIHESAHQPVPGKAPGLTLGRYGLWFNRHETWAEQAGPWVDYLARCSYMLQQGRFFGDVAYFYGEEGPLTGLYGWEAAKDLPQGYGFDYVNSSVLLHRLSVSNGQLVTPAGGSYRILYLGGRSQRMTLPVLRQILSLVEQGAVVVGNRPADSPSLSDDQAQVQTLADKLFGHDAPGAVRTIGKGKVLVGMSMNEALSKLQVAEDFSYTKPAADSELMFVHRKLATGDIYFVDNRQPRTEKLAVSFRVTGEQPELWDAATGKTSAVSYKIADGRTTVPLTLDPDGTVFVVFRKPAVKQAAEIAEAEPKPIESLHEALNGGWKVYFDPQGGGPGQFDFGQLRSWSEDAREGVKYYSGAGTYVKTINLSPETLKSGARFWLDLGDVAELAEVSVNGKPIGTAWKTPYRLEVTKALQPGSNRIAITVTNLWVNRIIGDLQPGVTKTYTFTGYKAYTASSPLIKSGLLGPVELLTAK